MSDQAVVDPFSQGLLCPCGNYYEPVTLEPVSVVIVPGAEMKHRPEYVPVGSRYMPPNPRVYRPRTWNPIWTYLVIAVLAVAGLAMMIVLVVQSSSDGKPAAPPISVSPTPNPSWHDPAKTATHA